MCTYTTILKLTKTYHMKKIVAVIFFICSFDATCQEGSWKQLFNGKNLKGWKQLGGKANYEVKDGMIIGTSTPNTPNSFLATEENYADFILEYEVWVDPSVNSGVQIRSNSRQDYRDGRVHGYQVELDPSPRAFTGGIYDESRRGWLYPLSLNPKGQKAFKNGVWNKFHVEAIGQTIKTWVNGIQCANLIDNKTASGFIALQVHSIGSPDQANKQIKWKNIRILTSQFEQNTYQSDPEVKAMSYLLNELTVEEKRKGWRLLWDGKSAKGWRGAKLKTFPSSGWTMKNGILSVEKTDGGESTGPGDIVTVDTFSDFELELEFNVSKGGNSGIKYYVDTELNKKQGSAIGCEFQILDDKVHPDAKMGVKGNRTVGSLYDLITAENLSVPGRGKQFKGVGVWNHARIIAKNGKVEHWLNNEKVVAYDRWSQLFKALVAYSKYKDWPSFGQWPAGHILLQDHGDAVQFRNIKIREF